MTLQQSFTKFIQLQGVIQLTCFFLTYSFLHVVGKIKVIKKCLNEKEKLRLLNTIGVSCKVSNTAVKDAKVSKSLFKLFATLEKKKKVLLK